MSDIDPALLFWLRHWDDMNALSERDTPPDGVKPDEWEKFQRVVASANHGVSTLLASLASDEVLIDAFRAEGLTYRSRSRASTIETNWYCDGSLGAATGAESVGNFWFGFLRKTDDPPPGSDQWPTAFAVGFYFAANGIERGERYIELAAKAGSILQPRFARGALDEAGRWDILLEARPLTASTAYEGLRETLITTARNFASTKEQILSARRDA